MKKEKNKDFKCACGCGVRLRVLYICWKNGTSLDVGLMKHGERKPKLGVVLRSDEPGYKEFIKFLTPLF